VTWGIDGVGITIASSAGGVLGQTETLSDAGLPQRPCLVEPGDEDKDHQLAAWVAEHRQGRHQ